MKIPPPPPPRQSAVLWGLSVLSPSSLGRWAQVTTVDEGGVSGGAAETLHSCSGPHTRVGGERETSSLSGQL